VKGDTQRHSLKAILDRCHMSAGEPTVTYGGYNASTLTHEDVLVLAGALSAERSRRINTRQ
jgi:hypothetical protein